LFCQHFSDVHLVDFSLPPLFCVEQGLTSKPMRKLVSNWYESSLSLDIVICY
jgi:hypothetical protein